MNLDCLFGEGFGDDFSTPSHISSDQTEFLRMITALSGQGRDLDAQVES